ncbi:MAG: plastocyanin/azurin family copper-binding protein [Opitutales bacterium]
MKRTLAGFIAFLILNVFAFAKDGSSSKETKPEEAKVDQTVAMTADDKMMYGTTSFEVKAGTKVKVTLKNIGMIPKIAMGHNFVLLKKGQTAFGFGPQVMVNGGTHDNGFIPAKDKEKILAYTKMLGPGEEDSVVFTAPEPGDYEYLCTFPGHFALMRGKMTVK